MTSREYVFLKVPHEGELIVCSVRYPTCRDMPRAYTLHVQPMEVQTSGDGFVRHTYNPRRGYRTLISEASRYNDKRLVAWGDDPKVRALAEEIVARVIADKAVTP